MKATVSVLVVAAHPDDEVLGCGASIARHATEGDVVSVLFLADGVGARDPQQQEQALVRRRAAARRACSVLGVQRVEFRDLPDNRLDQIALLDIVREIEQEITSCTPSVVYTHHGGDVNIDHRRVHDAVVTACRPQPGHPVQQLLFFETPSSTEWRPPASFASFAPNWFVDVSTTLSVKMAALHEYAEELRMAPHPRSRESVANLARYRGSCMGVDAAEAFELGRLIR